MIGLLKRFRDDERGAFMVLFGLMAVVLVSVSGAVVDYTTVEQARTRGQLALDAATLALQPMIYTQTEEQLRADAEDLIIERIADPSIGVVVETADVDTTEGRLFLQARLTIPTAFIGLVGVTEMNARLVAEATRKQLFLEVAFVLDNSGSMAQESRMANLKLAAACATNIIFYGSCTPASGAVAAENTRIGIVPFTSFVNVGTGYAAASWMDTLGASSISNDNFDTDDNDATAYTGAVNRFALYNQISNISWEGCVEARPYPYSVNDATPTSATPSTKFVPVFMPDEPDSGGYGNTYLIDNPPSCNPSGGSTAGHCQCTNWSGLLGPSGTSCTFDPTPAGPNIVSSTACSCPLSWQYIGFNLSQGLIYNYTGGGCSYTMGGGGGGGDNAAGLSDRERQERLCKYTASTAASVANDGGPNSDCPGTSMLALSASPSTVQARITAMSANGYTNIHQGTIWGFHMLSPTEPLTEGRAYDTATSKVMIIMTDGENTFTGSSNMNGSSRLQAYGHFYNAPDTNSTPYQPNPGSRLGYTIDTNNQMPTVMNMLTEESCTNAKEAGIVIYTIGLEPPNTATQTMLENCASGPTRAYFPDDAAELNDVFTEIASQLSALRLAL